MMLEEICEVNVWLRSMLVRQVHRKESFLEHDWRSLLVYLMVHKQECRCMLCSRFTLRSESYRVVLKVVLVDQLSKLCWHLKKSVELCSGTISEVAFCTNALTDVPASGLPYRLAVNENLLKAFRRSSNMLKWIFVAQWCKSGAGVTGL